MYVNIIYNVFVFVCVIVIMIYMRMLKKKCYSMSFRNKLSIYSKNVLENKLSI